MEGVSIQAAQVLVELIGNSKKVEKELLGRRFLEQARGYEETLKFMEGMRAIRVKGREIHRAMAWGEIQKSLLEGKQTFAKYLTKLGIESGTQYGDEMREVVRAFRLEGGSVCLQPKDLRVETYTARNILLEAGALQVDHQTGTYTINQWFYREFVRVRYAYGVTPEDLEERLKERGEIGLEAELKVLEYERDAVGDRDALNVIHIALENTNAGFDIASTRREKNTDKLLVRMIEVKAVSSSDWGFTLTRNEVRVATESKDAYFLYLIPVIAGEPTIKKMNVVQNPVMELRKQDEWTIVEGDWRVSRKQRYG